jgi:hypothetical protein
MNIPSFNIPMPVLMGLGITVAVVLAVYLFHRFVYRRGYDNGYAEGHAIGKQEGQEIAKLKGAFCDVCQKVAEKFVAFKMHVICEACFSAITANKDQKCKFCNNPVENCSCT